LLRLQTNVETFCSVLKMRAVCEGEAASSRRTPKRAPRVRKNIRVNWCSFVVSFAGMKECVDFQIRPARVQDVPIVLQLIRDLATYERAPDEVVATEEQLIDVLFGERRVAKVLLAFEGESPVGFAVYFYNFSTWLGRAGLYLEDLFVRPEKRGKGYGRALLVELAKIARDHGCGRMEWAVLDWNEPAIDFYRALGAKPMDEWTVFRLTRKGITKLASAAGRLPLQSKLNAIRSTRLRRGYGGQASRSKRKS
jgi:GNAT superfamily N-acetyltransferase